MHKFDVWIPILHGIYSRLISRNLTIMMEIFKKGNIPPKLSFTSSSRFISLKFKNGCH